jgi:DNA-binding XRE family transcriptional regulator
MEEQTLKPYMPLMDLNGKTFGQRVRERRLELGWTQDDLALGISFRGVEFSQSFLSQIENDRYDPNRIGVEKAIALCAVLDKPFRELFWGLTE